MKPLFALLGSGALALYMVLFTAGVALDSKPYREFLAPTPVDEKTDDDANPNEVGTMTASLGGIAAPQETKAPVPVATIAFTPEHIGAFVRVMFVYTPINIAFLALLAAFLGGCASYITYAGTTAQDAKEGEVKEFPTDDAGDLGEPVPIAAADAPPGAVAPATPTQAWRAKESEHPHRTESPFASMFRGFLIYLGMMAGMYVIADNPFEYPTAQQYVRLASTVSLFAFVVGYDPTKFRDWIDRVPRLGAAR